MIDEAWDLPALREHYEQFIDDFDAVVPDGRAAAFAAQTAIVHAWRRFPFIDPDLPDDLLPRDWPRRRAYELFRDRHEAWAPAAQTPLRRVVTVTRRKRIYVAYVGGTIGMQPTASGYAPVTGNLGAQIRQTPELHADEVPELSISEYEPLLDSANARPADWLRIARDIVAAPARATTASSSCTARTRWPTPPPRSRSCCAGSASRSSSPAPRSRSACCAATGARTC